MEEFQEAAGLPPGEQTSTPQPTGVSIEAFQQMNDRFTALMEDNRQNRELLTQFIGRQNQNQSARPEPDEDEAPEIDGDVADDFATNGMSALTKRGVVTKKEAREIAREEARTVAREEVARSQKGLIQDAELAKAFPALADSNSELFKLTKKIYQQEIDEDPSAAKNPRTLLRAAKEAQAELVTSGRGRGRQDDDFEDRRQQRIDAQSGDRGYGRRSQESDDDDTLSANQRNILAKFQASGEGSITEEDYKQRARKISMGGIPKGNY